MKFRSVYLILLIILIALVQPTYAFAKEYTIPAIRVEVDVQPDGTIRITEHRTYDFEDDFSWVDYRLPFKGFTAVTNIRVSEAGVPFINKNTEEAGTFLVNRSDDQLQIQWFYNAEDEQRTFTISYTLEGAIVNGPEWSEFFWNYISANREKDTDSLQIDLTLPRAIGSDSLYTWKRGPHSKITLKNSINGYTVNATNVDDDESVKIRMVFPRSVFNQNAVSTNDAGFTLQQAQADEEAYQKKEAERQKRNARLAAYGQKLAVVVCLLSIIGFIFFYRKYGKRHSTGTASSTPSIMIPGRLKPAVAGWLLSGRSISSVHLTATLLDLARRKYFIIKEQKPEKKWLSKDEKVFTIENTETQPSETLTDWEKSLVEFVSEQISEDNTRIDELFSESSYSASKWFKKWKNKLKEYCKTNNWYDKKSYEGVYANVALQIVLLAGGILATIWAGPIGIVPMIISFTFLVASAAIIRRTPEGEQMHKKWNAYKEGLKNAKDHSVEKDLLDKHFIYATAFGLSKDNIEAIFAQYSDTNIAFYWVVFHPGHTGSPANIGEAFSTLSASGAASFPGASAAGAGAAGASAGAAGGGAAGGAG